MNGYKEINFSCVKKTGHKAGHPSFCERHECTPDGGATDDAMDKILADQKIACESNGGSWNGTACTSTGDQIGTDDGICEQGWVWLDLYNMCIPIS
jgi:hypothetical protein